MFIIFFYYLVNLLFLYIQIIFTVKIIKEILNKKEITLKENYYN